MGFLSVFTCQCIVTIHLYFVFKYVLYIFSSQPRLTFQLRHFNPIAVWMLMFITVTYQYYKLVKFIRLVISDIFTTPTVKSHSCISKLPLKSHSRKSNTTLRGEIPLSEVKYYCQGQIQLPCSNTTLRDQNHYWSWYKQKKPLTMSTLIDLAIKMTSRVSQILTVSGENVWNPPPFIQGISDIYPLNSEYLGHTQDISAKYHLSTLVSVGFILKLYAFIMKEYKTQW